MKGENMIKIYLDNCCYSRPFDNEVNKEIENEIKAIEKIMKRYLKKELEIYKSKIIDFEINKMPIGNKRRQVEDLYDSLELKEIKYSDKVQDIVKRLKENNINNMDAYHIAYAEKENIEYFITVDKILINKAKKIKTKIKVINPIDFGGD